MVVLKVPLRLRFAALALLLSIAWIAMEIVIEARAPWWKLPYAAMAYWSASFALISYPLYSWIVSGRRWAYGLVFWGAGFWIFITGWLAIQEKNPSLGFFALFLLIYFMCELLWLRHEMNKSFLDPQTRWYQAVPKPIHGLECQIASGEKALEYRVSRIDCEGAFLYLRPVPSSGSFSDILKTKSRSGLDVVFSFRDKKMQCRGLPVLAMQDGKGLGIQFTEMSFDQRKEVGDFVEALRVQGLI